MSVYDELGVKTIINADGPVTRLSGAIMSPEVVKAIVEASKFSVDMEQLQAKASKIISETTGAEAGIVTPGASAALSLATAACVAGFDITKMERLPNTAGMKNEVVIIRSHRNPYDHAIRLVGVTLIEVGLDESSTGVGVRKPETWEIESAINEKTAAIAYLAKSWNSPSLSEVSKIAKKRDIPIIVDAAAELPPASNLRAFINDGADLVAFSGGKAIGGPQSSGILCGKRDLIMSAAVQMLDSDCRFETWNPPNNFIDKSRFRSIPRQGIGRGFKAGKEEIIGLLTALQIFASNKSDDNLFQMKSVAKFVAESFRENNSISAKYVDSTNENPIPTAEITFKNDGGPQFMFDLILRLKAGNPPIYFNETNLDKMGLIVNPSILSKNQAEELVSRLKTLVP
jgi:D-glucosaminate-6-phosphate ammonia-lyase